MCIAYTDTTTNNIHNIHNYDHKNYTSIDDVIIDARKELLILMANLSVPGSVVAFSLNGKTVWSEGLGLADIENTVPTHLDSPWRVCSISKSIASVLIGQLLERKVVDLDKPINNYLPLNLFPIHQYNGTNYTLTLRLLMSHLAGLHVTKHPDDFRQFFRATNVTQMIGLFNREPLLVKPGTEWLYSNYGSQVVGSVVEQVLNSSYAVEIEKLFVQLGMSSTRIERHEQLVKHRPKYYELSPYGSTNPVQNGELIDEIVWQQTD
ncbi:serine beta-lactamase-like protein LACTB, mitochondrial [Oppia nitens]|uniref:serine beta-lactamase-like protein LACTB, mitochondrial n=1 Tax=Oppia nitens TaxID=1686743 RepID=UPI0023DBF0A3|nr:serine beta-lactamase-like protein LACTB, mitochondrial [Oppia nitens]